MIRIALSTSILVLFINSVTTSLGHDRPGPGVAVPLLHENDPWLASELVSVDNLLDHLDPP